ncbi:MULTISPECIES: extracellular solute-binding protein [unclassified Coleofasciculus]|uniref:extracellular solute-binding protein n=1 Tax=unclassified Coleofasciculus TaxID=2692782 RepID=UPI001882C941|nr:MULTISPECIES: extracellular solute-binding protein [unclassified Coleofasciculus]MBE9125926.1 extracellular solute-binding protein [Coleofasciculus sp. LEGE 07081]MBE9149297.1 extracellular solute-binding protein [Coleofasciculus sp. LEGE 07092]
MKRRSFLVGASALTLGQLASGCNSRQQQSLNVRLLKDSIPAQLLGEFRKALTQPIALNFEPETQLVDVYKRLEIWKRQAKTKDTKPRLSIPFITPKTPAIANLVTLGDYWLDAAIEQELIQPLELSKLPQWQQLPPRWQLLVQRNRKGKLDKSGLIWGAPYRWGSTVIAYRRDKFKALGWTPTQWSDLWRPELRDRISLLDHPREVIGLTLKKLGFSYNTPNLSEVPNLEAELLALHQQAKFYSSKHYLEPLILGDTWLAVGWSTDILALRGRDRQVEAVLPQPGTALWADVWVQPTARTQQASTGETADSLSPTQQWVNFCWQQQSAIEISLLSDAASPLLFTLNPQEIPPEIRKNPLLLPDLSVLNDSEFLYPLPKEAVEQYEELWQAIRPIKVT